jgi:hypothetical protein
MSTAANAAAQESQEDIDARLAQERIDSGEDFEPTNDDEPEAVAEPKAEKPKDAPADISAETLALIAGEDKPATVPHARFNEVNLSKKAAEARVHELELELARLNGKAEASAPKEPAKLQETPKEYDFDAAEDRYQEAFLDGDKTNAAAIRTEIRGQERAQAKAEAEAAADLRYNKHREDDDAKRTKLEFDLELSKAYAAYPFLNAEAADANADAIEETLVWTQHFRGKGMTAAEALKAAAAKVGPAHTKKGETPPVETPKPDIQKGIDRANQIPAKAQGVGERANKLDLNKMSDKDFKNLPQEEEDRLSGKNL